MFAYLTFVRLRLSNAFHLHGLAGTLYRICRYPLISFKSAPLRRKIFSSADLAEVFTQIYRTNWWGSNESVSGTGSTIEYTAKIRAALPELFRNFGINSVFDAPCGDFNWMRHVVESSNIEYLGVDIVPDLIASNIARFQTRRTRFHTANIICDVFPVTDLWLCRDCLIHFSFTDIYLALENFVRSDARYLLTTTHINTHGFRNIDIVTGDARQIDLFSAPFFLPRNYLFAIEDWVEPDVPRMLVLFERAQIASALPKMKSELNLYGSFDKKSSASNIST